VFSQDAKELPAKDKKHKGNFFLIVGLLTFVVGLMIPRMLYTTPAIIIVASLAVSLMRRERLWGLSILVMALTVYLIISWS